MHNIRIGQGYDVHKLVNERALILGGVNIPHDRGLLGHSDADVLCHAIIDALFGAAGMGDIGTHFPDTDQKYHNADSMLMLKQCVTLIQNAGWQIINVDATIIAQKPKLAPYIMAMRDSLRIVLGMKDHNSINIKAKTNEKLGYLGREEAIEVQAIALIANI